MMAIMGGTFDPLHFGHIRIAEHTAQQFNFSEIILLPAHIPPHKTATGASSQHRLEMLAGFAKKHLLFEVDGRELQSNATSFTVNTLKAIKAQHPKTTLCFIIGMDSLLTFTRWHLWQEILSYCHLIVNTRPGSDIEVEDNYPTATPHEERHLNDAINTETQMLLAKYQSHNKQALLESPSGKIFINPSIHCDISSSDIRQTLAKPNLCIEQSPYCQQWLPTTIIEYIVKHNLYQH